MSESAPVEVFAARDTPEAYFVRNLLKRDGIEAVVVGENLRAIVGELPPLQTTVRLWVSPHEAERARRVVAEYDQRQRQHADQGSSASAEMPAGSSSEEFCYHCGHSVSYGQSPCPMCGNWLEWDSDAAVPIAAVAAVTTSEADTTLVQCEVVDGLALLTLNHPEKRNPLSLAMLRQLKNHLGRIGRDREVRAVVVRAAGTAFSAGHDLRELLDASAEDHRALFELCSEVMQAIRNIDRPVIAEVQGVATAAGCQLVASCDLAVASESATFATPGVRIGLFCTTPAIPLVRTVPLKKAMEMLLTGDPISARDAERIGLVNRVVPHESLHDETMKLARQITSTSATAIGIGKRALYQQLPLDIASAYEMACDVMVRNALDGDAQEGIRAFLQKRPPQWRR